MVKCLGASNNYIEIPCNINALAVAFQGLTQAMQLQGINKRLDQLELG